MSKCNCRCHILVLYNYSLPLLADVTLLPDEKHPADNELADSREVLPVMENGKLYVCMAV